MANKERFNDEHVQTVQGGSEHIRYPGLLDTAHKLRLVGIETELLQKPEDSETGTAIVRAKVTIIATDHSTGEYLTGTDGSYIYANYYGIGDANENNVSRNIVPHLIRMAETRAKARALRDAINIGETAEEEKGGDPDAASQTQEKQNKKNRGRRSSQSAEKSPSNSDKITNVQLSTLEEQAEILYDEGGRLELEKRIKGELKDLTKKNAESLILRLQREIDQRDSSGDEDDEDFEEDE